MIRRGRSKYGNKKVTDTDGTRFDSKKEMERWHELKKMQEDGLISELQRQVSFLLIPDFYKTVKVQLKTKEKTVTKFDGYGVKYKADFVYLKDGQKIIEDTKALKKDGTYGIVDPVYILKKKMMRYLLGLKIQEV